MAKPKSKAGKKAKAAPKKRAVKKVAPKRVAAAAPSAPAKAVTYPVQAIVNKGAEKIPVTVASADHHRQLNEEFGAHQVEVQK